MHESNAQVFREVVCQPVGRLHLAFYVNVRGELMLEIGMNCLTLFVIFVGLLLLHDDMERRA